MPEMMPLVQANDGRPAAVATTSATSQKDSGSSGLFYDALAALLGVANGDAASSAPALPALSQGEAPAPRQDASPDGNVLPPYAASVPVPVNPGVQNGMNVSADDNPGVTSDAAHIATMAMTAGSPSIIASPAGENPRALSDLSQAMLPVLASESAMSSANFASVLDDTPAGVTLTSQPAIPAGSQVNSQSPAGHAAAAMTLPLGAEGWGQELGDRVQWLVNQSVQAAELRINPPHLGPVEIRIAIDQDQASVSFTAQHSVTRDAIEAAIPRLRDMLGDSGLNLASINVSSQSQSFADQRGQQTVPQQYAEYMGGAEPLAADESSAGVRGVLITGLVDYYA